MSVAISIYDGSSNVSDTRPMNTDEAGALALAQQAIVAAQEATTAAAAAAVQAKSDARAKFTALGFTADQIAVLLG
jgi:hypothetical protein